jgi:hypothetical protein
VGQRRTDAAAEPIVSGLNPPPRAERVARWSLAPWERPALLGDLQEEFRDLSETAGEGAARRWYWRQAIASVWPNVIRRLRGDDRRHALWSQGMQGVAFGCLMLVTQGIALTLSLSPVPRRFDPFIGTAWMLFGATTIAESILRKRVRARAPQIKCLAVFWIVAIVGSIAAIAVWPRHSQQILWAPLLPAIVIRLWPWWPPDPPPTEFRVRAKSDPDQNPEELLTINVPNIPLGLSGLVLCHAAARAAVGAAPHAIHREEPTIDRAFTDADAVRVCAVVNLAGPPPHATLDVVDAAGHVSRTVQTTVAAGSLEQVPATWDDVAEDDPAEHFGQVDVTLPLADLAPGAYRLRVTAADAAHTSQREEPIVVRASPVRLGS